MEFLTDSESRSKFRCEEDRVFGPHDKIWLRCGLVEQQEKGLYICSDYGPVNRITKDKTKVSVHQFPA
jgi:hypothetical protein